MKPYVETPLVAHRVLYQKLGENLPTPPSPVALWSGQVDLAEEGTFCLSFDDNRLVPAPKYEVVEVELPYWLSLAEWLRDPVAWKWAWGCDVDPLWPEPWQRALAYRFAGALERMVCVGLLKTREFRNDYRASMRHTLVAWLDTPADARVHPQPFSSRQWETLIDRHLAVDARRRDSNLYGGWLLGAPRPAPRAVRSRKRAPAVAA